MASSLDHQRFIDGFRLAGPYINTHRGKTAVIAFGGEALDDERFPSLIHDIALLHSLGLRVVLVHGARPQIQARLDEAGVEQRYAGGLRITDEASLPLVKEAIGRARIRIEALLSMGLPNSPMHGARIRVVSGNVVIARPLGIRDGVDYCFTGEVRRIDHQAIRAWLDGGAIVLLSSLGYSPTGEAFNLSADEVAIATASSLRADKLLLLSESGGPLRHAGGTLRELSPADAERLLAGNPMPTVETERLLRQALAACRAGVRRIHLLDWRLDGALLLELFTRDGVGTLLTADIYEGLRPATIDDVGGILELIRPLEEEGILVRRSRELLETEIERFIVLERDGTIIGCAALYPFPEEQVGELACVAVHPDYRNSGRADVLLRHAENEARKRRLKRLFVLTTRTAHWFLERGFQPGQLGDLPVKKQAMYNFQRRSKVFIKPL
ncbi:MAG TPA: amino-acid N-acetyltransferase [Candidatus Competibacteraceae bacterium]|nr:amino-acid N-acetyltransferase [Candidatus Competibacteraceae bacterium]